MRLSLETKYAVRILLALTHHHEDNPVTAQNLARETQIDLSLVQRVLERLNSSNIIVSSKSHSCYLKTIPSGNFLCAFIQVMENDPHCSKSINDISCIRDDMTEFECNKMLNSITLADIIVTK